MINFLYRREFPTSDIISNIVNRERIVWIECKWRDKKSIIIFAGFTFIYFLSRYII